MNQLLNDYSEPFLLAAMSLLLANEFRGKHRGLFAIWLLSAAAWSLILVGRVIA